MDYNEGQRRWRPLQMGSKAQSCSKTSLLNGKPSDVFRILVDGSSSSRKRQSLEIVWRALNELVSENAPDLSISRVGARVENLGGPRTQSLRNKNGEDFRRLISAFAQTYGKRASKKTSNPPRPIDEAINQISEFNVRTSLRLMLAENAQLKHENDQLRVAFSRLSVDLTRAPMPSEESQSFAKRMPTSAAALEAFKTFLSSEWLSRLGFEAREDGSIFDVVAGQLVAPSGFAIGLTDIVGYAGSSTDAEADSTY